MAKGYTFKLSKGKKSKLLNEMAVFGTKKDASLYEKELNRLNPNLKREFLKRKIKLKLVRI